MIVVDEKKCNRCGLCAKICHEHCITLSGSNGNRAVNINHTLCSTCTQCIAVCPKQALTWNQIPAEKFNRSQLPSAKQLSELLQQRRTTRHFKDKVVNRALVEEIVDMGIYAPTNNYELRAIIFDSSDILLKLDAITMSFIHLLYNNCYKSDLVFNLCQKISKKINAKSRAKLAWGVKQGHSYGSLSATSIFIVGDRHILLSEASAQYALYNMILYAQLKGLGSRIQTGGAFIYNKNRKARKILGLARHENVLAMLELGFPAIRFSNKVQGKQIPITWIGGNQNE